MADFQFRAINKDGQVIVGKQSSTSLQDLENKLTRLNMEILSYKELKPLFSRLKKRSISRRDLINFCFYLEQMLRSGVPLVEAMQDLQDSMPQTYFGEVIADLVAAIKEGVAFSESLKEFPTIFSDSFINLIKAGERSGELNTVLKDLTDTLTWQDELIAQTKKALMLPIFMGVIIFSVVFFLMTYLVPQLVIFITSMGQELPLHTRILIIVSDFFVNYWWLMILTPTLTFISIKVLLAHSPAFRLKFDLLKLKIWILGPLIEKITLARFVNYLALLYSSGIPLIESLKITESIVDNKALEQALQKIRRMISDGASISVAFEMSEIFPRLVLSMIRVGEKTGDLGPALQNVGYFFKRDVDEVIANLQQMIEPVITVIMGAIIGWVMVSVLGPIYDLISNIKM